MEKKESPKKVLSMTEQFNLKMPKTTYNRLLSVCDALQCRRSEGVRRCIDAVYLGMKQAEGRSNNGTNPSK
jgi:hypothetical protein